MKQECQYLFKKKKGPKKYFKTYVNWEIITAHNTQLILHSIPLQELLGGKLLRLTNKETFYTEACYKEGE